MTAPQRVSPNCPSPRVRPVNGVGNPAAGREGMLDAAEAVILRDGIGRLTLQAVAREAQLSKSGLLHHFPNKPALIDALVERIVSNWQRDMEVAIEAQAPGPGRVPRAILGRCLASTEKWTEEQRRSSLVLVAALVHDQRHVEPLRRAHQSMRSRIETDGLPPAVGSLAQLTVHGVWFDWIFGLSEWTPHRLGELGRALAHVLERAMDAQRRDGDLGLGAVTGESSGSPRGSGLSGTEGSP